MFGPSRVRVGQKKFEYDSSIEYSQGPDEEVFQLVEEEESDQIRHLCSIVGAQGDVELFPRTPLLTVVL